MPGHLTIEERDRIAQLRFQKFSQKEIALAVGRSTSTLSRELQRNSSGEDYLPGQAQQKALERRSERPLGDFEGDTVRGPPGTGGVITLVDRKSRFTVITKIQSKDAEHVRERMRRRLKELEEERRHSITFDNGTEFARCYRLEKHLGLKLYFADPGCPHQRGTNENTNGLIRQYFPKGTNFRDISHCQVREVEKLLNNRPRACLGFRTPAEVFFEKTPSAGCD